MKNWVLKLVLFFGFLCSAKFCIAQDYSDLGRTKREEFKILRSNNFKISKIRTFDESQEMYLAKRIHQKEISNIISIDKFTHRVVNVIFNFNPKNLKFIGSYLSHENLTHNASISPDNKN